MFPVNDGKWFTEMSVGRTLPEYDSLLALTHFKGHTKGGFGDGEIGKAMIHTTPGQNDQWDISGEEFMERMTKSSKAVIDIASEDRIILPAGAVKDLTPFGEERRAGN